MLFSGQVDRNKKQRRVGRLGEGRMRASKCSQPPHLKKII